MSEKGLCWWVPPRHSFGAAPLAAGPSFGAAGLDGSFLRAEGPSFGGAGLETAAPVAPVAATVYR